MIKLGVYQHDNEEILKLCRLTVGLLSLPPHVLYGTKRIREAGCGEPYLYPPLPLLPPEPSYGAIGNYLGAPRSARMVGYAMNGSHGKDVPAHRVVNRKGLLTGKHHFDGTNLMQQLLESEGIVVIENQIQDLKTVYWDPTKELL